MAGRRLGVDVFSTGQVARCVGVAPRTVTKWFDSGVLKGYRIPGSQDRRIMRDDLLAFLRLNGLPTESITGLKSGGGRVLCVGLSDEVYGLVSAVSVSGLPVVADTAADDLEAWEKVIDGEPDVVVASGARAGLLARVRARTPHAWLVWVGCEWDTGDVIDKVSDLCDLIVPFPQSAQQVTDAVRAWREQAAAKRARSDQRKVRQRDDGRYGVLKTLNARSTP